MQKTTGIANLSPITTAGESWDDIDLQHSYGTGSFNPLAYALTQWRCVGSLVDHRRSTDAARRPSFLVGGRGQKLSPLEGPKKILLLFSARYEYSLALTFEVVRL